MITRAEVSIFQTKTYLTAFQDLEPNGGKATLHDIKWYLAMKETTAEAAAKIVGNKLVYRVKYNPNGNISKYKACLVAK